MAMKCTDKEQAFSSCGQKRTTSAVVLVASSADLKPQRVTITLFSSDGLDAYSNRKAILRQDHRSVREEGIKTKTTDTAFDLVAAEQEQVNIADARTTIYMARYDTAIIGSYAYCKLESAWNYLRIHQQEVSATIADYFKEEA